MTADIRFNTHTTLNLISSLTNGLIVSDHRICNQDKTFTFERMDLDAW